MRLFIKCIVCLIGLFLNNNNTCFGLDKFSQKNWKFFFPKRSNMGVFLAIALPLELPKYSAYLAYYFEVTYKLPSEASYEYPPLVQKRMSRQMIYEILESKIESNGYNGRNCLLRTICEAAANPLDIANGVLGDVIHVVLTPSTSMNENLKQYEQAEIIGKDLGNCTMYHSKCSASFLATVTKMEP